MHKVGVASSAGVRRRRSYWRSCGTLVGGRWSARNQQLPPRNMSGYWQRKFKTRSYGAIWHLPNSRSWKRLGFRRKDQASACVATKTPNSGGQHSAVTKRDISIWQFIRQFQRAPREVRSKDGNNNEENRLAQYIRKNKSKLHRETVTMLNMFTSSGGSIAQAKDDLQRLLSLDDPPDELVRCLKFIVKCPSYAAMMRAKYNEDGSESQI